EFAMCSHKLVRWCGPGCSPYSCTSSMCDNQVSGCQFAAYPVVKAHVTPCHVSPLDTYLLPMMYSGSSKSRKSCCSSEAYTKIAAALRASEIHRSLRGNVRPAPSRSSADAERREPLIRGRTVDRLGGPWTRF